MHAVLAGLTTALDEEGEALAAGDVDRLASIAAKKGALLAQLRSADTRSLDRLQLHAMRQLNHRNALLLAARMQANGGRLDALVQAGRGAALYDAAGTVAAGTPALRARSFA